MVNKQTEPEKTEAEWLKDNNDEISDLFKITKRKLVFVACLLWPVGPYQTVRQTGRCLGLIHFCSHQLQLQYRLHLRNCHLLCMVIRQHLGLIIHGNLDCTVTDKYFQYFHLNIFLSCIK